MSLQKHYNLNLVGDFFPPSTTFMHLLNVLLLLSCSVSVQRPQHVCERVVGVYQVSRQHHRQQLWAVCARRLRRSQKWRHVWWYVTIEPNKGQVRFLCDILLPLSLS